MKKNDDLQQKLKSGNRIYGTCIVSASPLWSQVAKNASLDFVFIDTEHISLARNEMALLCQMYSSLEITPIVRIPEPDAFLACMARDAGAIGIVIPYVEKVEQVRDLIGATKFRPLKGIQLQNVLNGKTELTEELNNYLANYNKGSLALINVESEAAISNLNALLDVPGLDGVIIGPHDLSISLGVPENYEHPKFEKAVTEIITRTRQKGLAVGIHFPEHADLQIKWMKAGANIILHGSDFFLFRQKLNEDINRIRNEAGDSVAKDKEVKNLSQI